MQLYFSSRLSSLLWAGRSCHWMMNIEISSSEISTTHFLAMSVIMSKKLFGKKSMKNENNKCVHEVVNSSTSGAGCTPDRKGNIQKHAKVIAYLLPFFLNGSWFWLIGIFIFFIYEDLKLVHQRAISRCSSFIYSPMFGIKYLSSKPTSFPGYWLGPHLSEVPWYYVVFVPAPVGSINSTYIWAKNLPLENIKERIKKFNLQFIFWLYFSIVSLREVKRSVLVSQLKQDQITVSQNI